MLVHLDEAKVPLNMARNGIHERRLPRARLTMEQVAAMIRDPMLGIESPRFIFQEPLKVVQQGALHAWVLQSFMHGNKRILDSIMGLYKDNEEENGSYYSRRRYIAQERLPCCSRDIPEGTGLDPNQ